MLRLDVQHAVHAHDERHLDVVAHSCIDVRARRVGAAARRGDLSVQPGGHHQAMTSPLDGAGRHAGLVGLFLVVSEPARFAEELLGTLTAGYVLDDTVAERLAEVTHCAVNLGTDDRLFASSLRGRDRTRWTRKRWRETWRSCAASSGTA